ncbi:MAG: hypothetical protein ACI4P8_02945 [Akkermansia sp.]
MSIIYTDNKIGSISRDQLTLFPGNIKIPRANIGRVIYRYNGLYASVIALIFGFLLMYCFLAGVEMFEHAHLAHMRLSELGVHDSIVDHYLLSCAAWENFQVCFFLPLLCSFIVSLTLCVGKPATLFIVDKNNKCIFSADYSLFRLPNLKAFISAYAAK